MTATAAATAMAMATIADAQQHKIEQRKTREKLRNTDSVTLVRERVQYTRCAGENRTTLGKYFHYAHCFFVVYFILYHICFHDSGGLLYVC